MLTAKQQRFVSEYLIDLNATQAAIRAGYSAKTGYAQGCRLLKDAEVQQAIAEQQEQRQERLEITQDDVIRGLWRIAEDDERQDSAQVSAYVHVGKHYGMFTDRQQVEHTGRLEVDSPDVAAAVDRFASLTVAAVRASTRDGAEPAARDADA